MRLCRELGALYIDTVVEPWPGFYFDDRRRPARAHQLRAARDGAASEKRASPGGPTAVSCCGANPGMVSWFVKQALLDLASDLGDRGRRTGNDREGWARPDAAGRRQGHPHRRARHAARHASRSRCNVFVNTWSVEGFISEGLQPAELGWGTHETLDAGERPDSTRPADSAAIYLEQPGANTRVRTWCPTPGAAIRLPRHPQRVDLDRRLLHACARAARSAYRPTCHYAYHPCNDAVLSLHEMFGAGRQGAGRPPHPRRERDRRRHRRARRAALRPRQERLLVRLAALDRGDARASRPTRTRPACR